VRAIAVIAAAIANLWVMGFSISIMMPDLGSGKLTGTHGLR
jgi:hypothetical protein